MDIEIPIDRMLALRGKSLYWLAKETGISYTTLWRLKSGKALGINFATLIKICEALKCTPGEVLELEPCNRVAGTIVSYDKGPAGGRRQR
jgi:putative transcriptional regulator